MDKFNWLLKKHDKALKVFENAKNDLLAVIQKFKDEEEMSSFKIEYYDEKIKSEREGLLYLVAQRKLIESRADKIQAILE